MKALKKLRKINSMFEAHEYVVNTRSRFALDYFCDKYGFMLLPYKTYINDVGVV